MRFILNILSYFIGNVAGLLAAASLLPDFHLDPDWHSIAIIVVLLVLGNVFIRPILKLLFHFVVILTLGLFTIVINVAILAAIDFFSSSIMITSIPALLYGTLIISIANLIVGGGIRFLVREPAPEL